MKQSKPIDARLFVEALDCAGAGFYAGVPDSVLKKFCDFVAKKDNHQVTVNEGAAVALAAGYHLATRKTAVVYLQNSGLGNALNPLLSLADSSVFGIPMVLIIGWRGKPGIADEIQHMKQGSITKELLELAEIPVYCLEEKIPSQQYVTEIFEIAQVKTCPVALLVAPGYFSDVVTRMDHPVPTLGVFTRRQALKCLIDTLREDAIFVASTGFTGRELFDLRQALQDERKSDLLMVGSMGHASQIALGLAKMLPEKQIICLDGDGSVLMHMGALATVGDCNPDNLVHVVLNNQCHESVGGQRSSISAISISGVAEACSYNNVYAQVSDTESLKVLLKQLNFSAGSGSKFIELITEVDWQRKLPRPHFTPSMNKDQIMRTINV